MKKIFHFFLVLILGQSTYAIPKISSKEKLRIIIDYGYSTKNQTTIEIKKQRQLKTIAKKLYLLLRKNGYKSIFMARKNNRLSCSQKIELAKQLKTSIFFSLSLYSDYFTKNTKIETHYPPDSGLFKINVAKRLSQKIQKNISLFFKSPEHQNACELSGQTIPPPDNYAFIEIKIISPQNKKVNYLSNKRSQNKLAYALYKSLNEYVSMWQ